MGKLSSRGIFVATKNPFKIMMLEPPWVFTAAVKEAQKEEVNLGAKHEWLREHSIDCLDDETASQRYTIFMKMCLGAATVHAQSYFF